MQLFKFKFIVLILFTASVSFANLTDNSPEYILSIINKVNQKHQESHPDPGNAFWENSTYHTGNMEVYKLTGNKNQLGYTEKWAEKNLWQGARGNDKSLWKYSYGETENSVLFGDWQICFQTYIDLYQLAPDSVKIKRTLEVINYQISTPNKDYWWWVDGLYMVMPVMTKLYKLTGDRKYLDKMYEYYSYSKSIMYDSETSLFFRDIKYIYPKHKSVNGLKDFWSRGNGWLFAALSRILPDIPNNWKQKKEFVSLYKKMAKSLAINQQKEGYWTRSLLDAQHAPGPETSGTAFFTYGMYWGINNGLLKNKLYYQAAEKGWEYLNTTALQEDGTIGYIQPVGEKAIPGQIVNAKSTNSFGVGAFLLAACEKYRFEKKNFKQ